MKGISVVLGRRDNAQERRANDELWGAYGCGKAYIWVHMGEGGSVKAG